MGWAEVRRRRAGVGRMEVGEGVIARVVVYIYFTGRAVGAAVIALL